MINEGYLENLCKIEYGTRVVRKKTKGDLYFVYGGGGKTFKIDKFNRENRVTISRFAMSENCTRYISGKFFLNDSGLTISPKSKDILQEYLDLLILSLNDHIYSLGRGTAQKNLNIDKFKKIKIKYPTINKQLEATNKLKKLLTQIKNDIIKINLNKSNINLLKENLLETHLRDFNLSKYKHTLQKLIDEKWITSHLDGNHGSNYPKKTEFVDNGIPYISAKCIEDNMFKETSIKFLTLDKANTIKKGIAFNNDILFAHNATVGPVAILQTKYDKVIIGTSLTYYRCNQLKILPKYLFIYMSSKLFKSQYKKIMKQMTRNQVPITKQRNFTHIIPPLDVQQRIIEKYDSINSLISKIELNLNKKIKLLKLLKEKLLEKIIF